MGLQVLQQAVLKLDGAPVDSRVQVPVLEFVILVALATAAKQYQEAHADARVIQEASKAQQYKLAAANLAAALETLGP